MSTFSISPSDHLFSSFRYMSGSLCSGMPRGNVRLPPRRLRIPAFWFLCFCFGVEGCGGDIDDDGDGDGGDDDDDGDDGNDGNDGNDDVEGVE